MTVWFRHGDPRLPFPWEAAPQPAARWHDEEDTPVTHLADSPDAAWAELLRHEEITDPADLAGGHDGCGPSRYPTRPSKTQCELRYPSRS